MKRKIHIVLYLIFICFSLKGQGWLSVGGGTSWGVADFIYFLHPCEFSDMPGKSMESDNDYENNAEITCVVYPNPTAGMISIEFSDECHIVSIEMFNVSGQRILFNEINATKTQMQLDISHLPNGVYMYKILNNDTILTGIISLIK